MDAVGLATDRSVLIAKRHKCIFSNSSVLHQYIFSNSTSFHQHNPPLFSLTDGRPPRMERDELTTSTTPHSRLTGHCQKVLYRRTLLLIHHFHIQILLLLLSSPPNMKRSRITLCLKPWADSCFASAPLVIHRFISATCCALPIQIHETHRNH